MCQPLCKKQRLVESWVKNNSEHLDNNKLKGKKQA